MLEIATSQDLLMDHSWIIHESVQYQRHFSKWSSGKLEDMVTELDIGGGTYLVLPADCQMMLSSTSSLKQRLKVCLKTPSRTSYDSSAVLPKTKSATDTPCAVA